LPRLEPFRPVVVRRSHDDGVAVAGQRDGVALFGVSNRAGANQLRPCCVNCASASCDEKTSPAEIRTDELLAKLQQRAEFSGF
jgi:hypothetical protein